jgi:hypothetical protein
MEEEMKKQEMYECGREMEAEPRDGELSTKTRWAMMLTRPRDVTMNLVSELERPSS